MVTQEKFVLGYRYKEKKSVYKKGFAAAIFLGIFSLGIAIGLAFLKADEEDQIFKFCAVGLMILCSVFFFCMIPLINKSKKQINDNNDYPVDAIYFEQGYIYIVLDKIVRIKPQEIEDVKFIQNEETTSYGLVNVSNKTENGSVTIITKDEKYFIPQIKNCKKVKEKILNIKKFKPYIVDDIYFIYNDNFNLNEFSASFKINDRRFEISFNNDAENLIYSVDTVKFLLKEFDNLYKVILDNIAKDIVELANEWNADNNITFTEYDIINRLEKSYVNIDISGSHYTIYLDDDNIFFGHSIVYYGEINSDKFSVDIAG